MATHGRSGLQRAFAGSVTERVLVECPVPVVVLKPGGKRLTQVRRLLVPVDGTAGGALALGSATALAGSTGARLDVLEVVPPVPSWMYGGGMDDASPALVDPEWEAASVQAAATYVAALAERLRKAGLEASGHHRQGHVAHTIEHLADEIDADLIVMSTHALTGPARAVLGSVADDVVRGSKRPVLLVRRPGGAADSAAPDLPD